jgi:hypothetical protein
MRDMDAVHAIVTAALTVKISSGGTEQCPVAAHAAASYSSLRRHQTSDSLRPFGARSSH